MVPTLETSRLILRPFRADDVNAQAAMLGDPYIMRYIGGRPLTREEAWRKLLQMPGMWALFGYGYWAVERKEDGAFIGQTGFGDFKRDISPSIEGMPEMGWLFASGFHGQGYAFEAVSAGLEWADKELSGYSFAAIINPANAPSIRLAERVGFRLDLETSYNGEAILLFRRPRLIANAF